MGHHFTYTGAHAEQVSFPLGGIGTGSIGLSGTGALIDWEIRNKPAKFSHNGFSFFALKAVRQGSVLTTRVIQGDLHPPFTGDGPGRFEGYGFGPRRTLMGGLPHFRTSMFRGTFPVAEIEFDDPDSPVAVALTALNPFIPTNANDSSLPVAMLTYDVTNLTDDEIEVSVVGCLSNPFSAGSVNTTFRGGGLSGVSLSTVDLGPDSPEYGEVAIATDSPDATVQEYWYRGEWFDNITVFWGEFCRVDRLPERSYAEPRTLDEYRVIEQNYDTCAVESRQTLGPGATARFRYALAWHFPTVVNDWNPSLQEAEHNSWKNHYATRFRDAADTARHVFRRWDRLVGETCAFRDTLYGSTLPEEVMDAVGANLSTLKSATVLRLTDGTLYGFEGCHTNEGSCEGSCTHVWNYEQVTDYLFPDLARSMRELDYSANQFPSGKMAFRTMLPLGRDRFEYHAAVDGQFGGIIRAYRQWRLSGDTGWLSRIWPAIKRALEFAWSDENEDGWDANRDGVLEGVQHHTLDVELYGPNPFLNGYYQAALLASAHMARALGDDAAETYMALYERGRSWIDDNAFNGEYYYQPLDLADPAYPLDPELHQIKYQIGAGCHVDQVIGQWHADLAGLGDIFDPEQSRSALLSIYRHNFVRMRDHVNTNRVYALNDERGVLICTWPRGDQPLVPVPYASETWTGLEYAFASSLISSGLVDEGLEVVRAARDRFDGRRRNPWSEFECGSHYVRAMSSYSLLVALSGFSFDNITGRLTVSPATQDSRFSSFWAAGGAWGSLTFSDGELVVRVRGDHPLRVESVASDRIPEGWVEFSSPAETSEARAVGGVVTLAGGISLQKDEALTLTF